MIPLEGQARDRFPLAQPSPKSPLAGVRVIDAGNMVSGPFAAALMADFGADVIKIEHPRYGDGERALEPIKYLGRAADNEQADEKVSLWWKMEARNKRCVTLDLSKPEGAGLFKRLIATADVAVENYRPGTFERWGLGYEELQKVNAGIILLRISGFGQTGPYRERAGFGRVAEAMSGLTNLIGEPDGPPMSLGYPLGDLITGLLGSWAVMVALYHRDARGGDGQVIDLGLYESVFRLLEFDPIQYDQLHSVHRRTGNRVSYVAPSSMFKTSDGKWLTLAASTRSIWLNLCRAIGREDLTTNRKFIDNEARVAHSEEVNSIFADWIAQRTREEVEKTFDEFGVAYSSVFDMEDVFSNEQYLAREMLVRVLDPQLGDAIVQNVVPKFSKTPGAVRHLGPRLGEHNEEVYLGELGLSREELVALKEAGVI